MSSRRDQVADYLTVRRALGFELIHAGHLLEQFVTFADAAGTDTITTQLAVQWATLPTGVSPLWHAQRLSVVRCFVEDHVNLYSNPEVPPADMLPARRRLLNTHPQVVP